jgi:hypothetical protein
VTLSSDPTAVLNEHQNRLVDVRNALSRKVGMDADRLRREDCCRLGAWLGSSAGQRCSHAQSFRERVRVHKIVHLESGGAADAVNEARFPGAESLIASGQSPEQPTSAMVSALRAIVASQSVVRGNQSFCNFQMPNSSGSCRVALPMVVT